MHFFMLRTTSGRVRLRTILSSFHGQPAAQAQVDKRRAIVTRLHIQQGLQLEFHICRYFQGSFNDEHVQLAAL